MKAVGDPDREHTTASAKSFRKCDPSGSLSNLRLEIPLNVVALRAA
jgi:hypothetical protein